MVHPQFGVAITYLLTKQQGNWLWDDILMFYLMPINFDDVTCLKKTKEIRHWPAGG